MNTMPMHDVAVDHDWHEVGRVMGASAGHVVARCCRNCGAKSRMLDLTTDEKTHRDRIPPEEFIRSLNRDAEQPAETIELQFRESLNGTCYPTKEDLRYHFTKRYNGNIKFENTPFGWLKLWATRHTRIR